MENPTHAIFQAANEGIIKIGVTIAIILTIKFVLEITIEKRKEKQKKKSGSVLIIIGMTLLFLIAIGLLKELAKPIKIKPERKLINPINTRKTILFSKPQYQFRTTKKEKNHKKELNTKEEKIYKWKDENGKIHYSNIGYPGIGKFTPME